MASSELSLLCQQIENQNTDHFGKFYMYVSLLNTVTVRKKTFADNLPKYAKGVAFWRENTLKIGEIPAEFSAQVTLYARQFINSQPHWSTALFNIAMAYARKGKISDLTYIIDQMLSHLTAIYGNQSHNQNIYSYINFTDKQQSISEFIEQISRFNQQILSLVDAGGNSTFSFLAALTGLVLVLASVFSLIPSLVGLGLMIGGGIGAYFFTTQAIAQAQQLEVQFKEISTKTERLLNDRYIFDDTNYNAFYRSIFTTIPYAALAAGEQISIDESTQKELLDTRSALDFMTDNSSTPSFQ